MNSELEEYGDGTFYLGSEGIMDIDLFLEVDEYTSDGVVLEDGTILIENMDESYTQAGESETGYPEGTLWYLLVFEPYDEYDEGDEDDLVEVGYAPMEATA